MIDERVLEHREALDLCLEQLTAIKAAIVNIQGSVAGQFATRPADGHPWQRLR